MLRISQNVSIPDAEIDLVAIRSQGAGGQNVNKVSSAIHLRFDIAASSLPDFYKQRLQNLKDKRISKDGIIVIKAQRFRTQEKNRDDALDRLADVIRSVLNVPKKRVATKPSKQAKKKRLEDKGRQSEKKSLRRNILKSE